MNLTRILFAVITAVQIFGFAESSFGQSFTAELVSPGTFITFDEVVLATNSSITNQYAAYGVTFTNAYYSPTGFTLPTGNHIANFANSVTNPYMGIHFLQDVYSSSFLLGTNRQNITSGPPGQTTFQALLDGNVVSQYIADTDLTQRSFGFSGIVFDEMRIYPGGSGNFGRLDNLQFAAVPEPSAIAGYLLGLGVLFVFLKQRRTSLAVREN